MKNDCREPGRQEASECHPHLSLIPADYRIIWDIHFLFWDGTVP